MTGRKRYRANTSFGEGRRGGDEHALHGMLWGEMRDGRTVRGFAAHYPDT